MNNIIQKIFNLAWQAFIIEGKPPSVGVGGSCLYRGPNGQKCVVGLLISDNEYNSAFEGDSAAETLDRLGYQFSESEAEIIDCMQYDLHDGLVSRRDEEWLLSPEDMRERYIDFATEHDLEVPKVEQHIAIHIVCHADTDCALELADKIQETLITFNTFHHNIKDIHIHSECEPAKKEAPE